ARVVGAAAAGAIRAPRAGRAGRSQAGALVVAGARLVGARAVVGVAGARVLRALHDGRLAGAVLRRAGRLGARGALAVAGGVAADVVDAVPALALLGGGTGGAIVLGGDALAVVVAELLVAALVA